MTEANAFLILARRRAKPGARDQLLEQIDRLMTQASHAQGFVSVDVIQALEDPDQILHYEVWSDQELHDAVVTGKVHDEFEARAGDLLERLWDPEHFVLLKRYLPPAEPADSDQRASGNTPSSAAASTQRGWPRGDGAASGAPARIPLVDPDGAPDDVRRVFEAAPAPLRVFGVLAHAQEAFGPAIDFTNALLSRSRLHPRLRQLAILHIARLDGAEYEWIQHAALARQFGVTDHQIAAIERGDIIAGILNHDERLVLRFAHEAHDDVRVSDATFQEAAERFSPQELVELLLAVGWYMAMSRLMRSVDLAPEPPGGRKQDGATPARRTAGAP